MVAVGKYYRPFNDSRDRNEAQFSEVFHIFYKKHETIWWVFLGKTHVYSRTVQGFHTKLRRRYRYLGNTSHFHPFQESSAGVHRLRFKIHLLYKRIWIRKHVRLITIANVWMVSYRLRVGVTLCKMTNLPTCSKNWKFQQLVQNNVVALYLKIMTSTLHTINCALAI